MAPDEVDIRILDQLRKNATIAKAELARRVGLSNTACRSRVAKLEKAGIIGGYSIVENVEKAADTGFISYVLWPLSAKSNEDFQEFRSFLSEIKEVTSIMLVAGEFDYLIKTSCINAKVHQMVHQKIQSHRLSGKPFTITVIETVK